MDFLRSFTPVFGRGRLPVFPLRWFTPVFGWRRLPEFSPPFVHICGTASAFSRLFTYVLSGIAFSTFPSSVYISIWTEMASSGFSSVYQLLWLDGEGFQQILSLCLFTDVFRRRWLLVGFLRLLTLCSNGDELEWAPLLFVLFDN